MHKFSQSIKKLELAYKFDLVKSFKSVLVAKKIENWSSNTGSPTNSRVSTAFPNIFPVFDPVQLQRISENVSDEIESSKCGDKNSEYFWGSSKANN